MERFTWQVTKKDKGTPWSMITAVAVIAAVVGAYLFLTENYFGAALFIIAPIVLLLVSTQGQKDFHCEISDEGIKVNNNFYPFKKLSFFAIIADSLIVKVKKEDVVYVPVYMEDTELIREILSEKIKEKDEYEENFAQIVNRILRIH